MIMILLRPNRAEQEFVFPRSGPVVQVFLFFCSIRFSHVSQLALCDWFVVSLYVVVADNLIWLTFNI